MKILLFSLFLPLIGFSQLPETDIWLFKIEDLGNWQIKLKQGEVFSCILSSIIFKSIGEETKNNFVKMNNT